MKPAEWPTGASLSFDTGRIEPEKRLSEDVLRDYVKNGVTGYACPPDDADAFASAIVKLTDDPDLRKKMKDPCQKAVRQFDKTHALNAMWKIYKEVL